MAQRKAEGGGRWMEGLEKVADCKTCLRVWKGKKTPGSGNFASWTAKKRRRRKKTTEVFQKEAVEDLNLDFVAATVDFAGFPFLEALQRNPSRLSSIVPLGYPRICFSCQKSAPKKPCQRSAEVVSGSVPFALSPRLFSHQARPTRPLARKYWE